jgi:hypothetical protein
MPPYRLSQMSGNSLCTTIREQATLSSKFLKMILMIVFPGNSSYISYSDFLTEGTFDLSAYRWNPSTKSPINVKITLESKDSASADLHVEYL